MRDGVIDNTHCHYIFLCIFNSLPDSFAHVICFTHANTHMRIAVADRDKCVESKPPAAFDDFGDAVDRYKTIDQLRPFFVCFYRFFIQPENPFPLL
jgi:hypothetical protein